jgi:hypothetical protein
VHHLSSRRAGAVQGTRLAAPEVIEQVGMTAIGQVRAPDARKQLVEHEVADAHAMHRGETADVLGEAFGLRSTDSNGLE